VCASIVVFMSSLHHEVIAHRGFLKLALASAPTMVAISTDVAHARPPGGRSSRIWSVCRTTSAVKIELSLHMCASVFSRIGVVLTYMSEQCRGTIFVSWPRCVRPASVLKGLLNFSAPSIPKSVPHMTLLRMAVQPEQLSHSSRRMDLSSRFRIRVGGAHETCSNQSCLSISRLMCSCLCHAIKNAFF
jgi:hypothetical protein